MNNEILKTIKHLDENGSLLKSPSKRLRKTSLRNSNSSFSISNDYEYSDNWSRRIPYEILLKIFSDFIRRSNGDLRKLDEFKKVCKLWSWVADDAKLYGSVDLSTHSALHNSSLNNKSSVQMNKFAARLRKLLNLEREKFKFITELNLNRLTCLTYDSFESMLKNYCNSAQLKYLNISNCKKLNHSSLRKDLEPSFERLIGDSCPNLTRLDMSGLDKHLTLLGSAYMFSKIGSNLKILNLSSNLLAVNYIQTLSVRFKMMDFFQFYI
jgi:hypothetical protein